MLEKTYTPKDAEERLYQAWEASGAFRAGNKPDAKPFTIVIPPPNVTGALHMGHALNNTVQDILARFERMRGRDVLWQPGMDHAGISTQIVVERQLAERQTSRQKLGREEFLKRVWEWKDESGGTILRQLKRLGASCDWSRDRFTMGKTETDQMSRAVLKVFVELYAQGLMYKDTRLVNWDPSLQTAVSDLEVENIEIKGNLWHIKYPLADHPDQFIIVATTRPETMLGDTAVAVHPDDERYRALVGKKVRLPLSDRLIPIVADEYANPEKGSGAVKITPGHDFNDYEVGRRHKLEALNILTLDGKINDKAPAAYRGLDRFAARKRVVADLEALGLIEKVEPVTHAVPHDEKTKTVVLEPMLTEQWYLNVKPLAQKALAAVRDGRTKFVPERFADEYKRWLDDIRPWCVSRQLWWGHQIPAWYDDKGKIYVAETEAAAQAQAGSGVKLTRDPDVLDTWFSSGLWPFSTLGWPDATPELQRYYPTDVLVTMFDIIFFWVARMMMFGLHFTKDAPFHTVYIHPRVVDDKGQKMSKTRGNVIDPLTLIDEFGADALRFALAIAAAAGKDLRIGRGRVEIYRNFCTKLWNAARFCEMNGCVRVEGFDTSKLASTVNRWIVGELACTRNELTAALEAYRFNDAAGGLYEFVWNVYCDWYLEFIKPVLNGGDEALKAETRATAAWVFDETLKLMHPFTPFITEELWCVTGEQGPQRKTMLISASWPDHSAIARDEAAASEMNWVKSLISEVRSVRAEMNVPPAAKLPLQLKGASGAQVEWLGRHNELILRLGRLETAVAASELAKGSAQIVVGGATAGLALAGAIDFAKERTRLSKDAQKADGEIRRIDLKLGNAEFVAKAPAEVVEELREKRAEYEAMRAKIAEALKRLDVS